MRYPTITRTITMAVALAAFVGVFSAVVPATTWGTTLDNLEQTTIEPHFEKLSKTMQVVNYLIDKSHFRKVPINDDFSEKVLNRFIKRLDPAKSFFLQEDIDKFHTVKYEFDDYIERGFLEPAYAIFKIYQTRVTQRIEYALHRLDQPFDFTLDESFLLDREDAVWAENEQVLGDYWRKRIKNDIINLRLAKKPDDLADSDADSDDSVNSDTDSHIIETLSKRYTQIARRTRQFNADNIFQTFINAYVTTIEPHTSYYSPRNAENFKINMRLSLDGIGAVLQTDDEYTLVRRVISGGPADIAGELKSDDRIIGVGQENEAIVDVIGWRLGDVVDLIRGPKGTAVKLSILSGKYGLDGKPQTITIIRDKIKLEEQAAKKRLLHVETEQGQATIGVIDLPSFYRDFGGQNTDPNYRSTTRDAKKLLLELKDEDIDGLIIDIRGNGGGALVEAISLTGLFIPKGPVVQIKDAHGDVQIERDPDFEIVYDGPLVVMVDRYSASASEIFAGAIQDYNRGLIIGEPTFGKGTVQNLVALNQFVEDKDDLGQLKITIAQFFRINGDSTQHRGVIPDIIWQTSEQDTTSGERSYENAIPWRHIDEASFMPFQAPLKAQTFNQILSKHAVRVSRNPEFDYALEVNQINKLNRNKKATTLHQDNRRENRKQQDLEFLTLENKKRTAQGKPSFATIELRNAEQDSRNKSSEKESFTEREPDIFLVESGKILTDFTYYKNRSMTHSSATGLVDQDISELTDPLNN